MMSMKRSFIIFFIYSLFFSNFVFAEIKSKGKASTTKTSYSFRPLLIRGKKHFSKKSKDLKVEGESIVESDIFSIKINFEERIFELGNM